MIYVVVAPPRTGKTWYIVCIWLDRFLKDLGDGFRLVSNVRGHKDADEAIGYHDDFMDRKFNKSVLVLDEVHKYFYMADSKKKNEMILEFAEHGHSSRHYIWITQSLRLIPKTWHAFVEQTCVIDSVGGSGTSRASWYLGIPSRGDAHISSEIFRPRKTDRYLSVAAGELVQKRKMPMKIYYLCAAFLSVIAGLGFVVNKVFVDGLSIGGANVIKKVEAAPVTGSMLYNKSPVVRSSVVSGIFGSVDDDDDESDQILPSNLSEMTFDQQLLFLVRNEQKIYRKCGNIYTDRVFVDCSKLRHSRKNKVESSAASLMSGAARRAAKKKGGTIRSSYYDYRKGQWIYE